MGAVFPFWAFFGLTFLIDILTHVFKWKKDKRINPYKPLREVSVIIPVHKEPPDYLEKTVGAVFSEKYPVKNVVICAGINANESKKIVKKLSKKYKNLIYCECPHQSKARKINYAVATIKKLGDFIYVRDCRVTGNIDCIEKIVSYFNEEKVAAVTSYGRVSVPRNFLSRSYFYGKAWINEIGRFRKNAQEKRRAIFVVCGASTMFRKEVLKKIPIPSGSKTEDTYYTWILQKKGFSIRVADDAIVSAPEVDGEKFEGIKGQIKQSYRWSCGTMQCMYREGRDIFKNKRLAWTTIFPGLAESVMYTIPLVLLPILFFIAPVYGWGFLIGDTVFSLLGTAIILPRKFFKTLDFCIWKNFLQEIF